MEERFDQVVESIRERLKEKFGEDKNVLEVILEDFEGNVLNISEWLWNELEQLDTENCETCRILAEKYINRAIEMIESSIACYEQCYGYFEELAKSEEPVEPPCTSYCSVVQSKQINSFNFAGHIEWFSKTYKHDDNCGAF